MPNQLFFHAYNAPQVAQCRYFLLKYLGLYNLKPPADTTVIVYTNNPVAFESFINFFARFEMPEVLLNAAAGTLTQTAVLQQALLQYKGAMLYCNTATYPLQPLEHLFSDIEKGALYLHAPYRRTESELNAALRRFSVRRDKTTTAVTTPQVRTTVWHAAVAGFSSRHKELPEKLLAEEAALQNALATDYAFTKVFSEQGKIKSAAKYIFDYSELKEFTSLLNAFFTRNEEESIPNQVKLLHHLDAATVQQQKEAYQQQPLFKKWLQIITGKRWSVKQYEKRW
jgi:hypothetical protein